MKITIVTAYNKEVELTEKFLNCMQDTLIGQNINSYVVLVNGGCETKIKHSFVNKRIDLETNEGFCKTLNAGLIEVPADSDYVFFVGNDSFPVTHTWLQDLVMLQVRTKAWMVCPANDNPGMRAYEHLYTQDKGDYWEVNFFPSIVWLMPYDKFKKVGLLDEQFIRTGMYADNDYCNRVRLEDGLIVVSKTIMLTHLLSAEGRKLGTQNTDMMVNYELYKKKWN